MIIKLLFGILLFVAALGLWNNPSSMNASARRAIATICGILGIIFLLPAVLSFAISGIITIAIILAVLVLIRIIF